MKYLIYIINLLSLFSCIDERNMEELKTQIHSDLYLINRQLSNAIQQFLTREIKEGKLIGKKRKSQAILDRISNIEHLGKSYIDVIEHLDKCPTSEDCKVIYQHYHKKFIGSLKNDLWMWEDIKEQLHNSEKLLAILTNDDIIAKEIIKQQISKDNALVLQRFFAKDFGTCGFDLTKIISNIKSIQNEEDELIELTLFLTTFFKSIEDRNYSHDVKTNRGIIQEVSKRRFKVSIPTQKLGTQEFTVGAKVKNWETEKDTTLYFTKTFEVIK